MRVWLARLFALLALLGAVAAILLAVSSVKGTDEVTVEEAQGAMLQLATTNGALSDKLDALKAGVSPKDAQAATRATAAATRKLQADIPGEGTLADQLLVVYSAELTYLDAVGSTLNNPSSPLRGRVGATAQALRDALQQVPGGDHRAIRGGMALVQYSEARAGG
ncbi:MAG: hypothetical protein JWM73_1224 [Solirubrobacterales bacterium]|nr:hypothetical protein [Solirubrobacterales bacterium]